MTSSLLLIVTCSAVIDLSAGLVGLFAFHRRSRMIGAPPTIGAARLLLAVTLAAAAFFAKLLPLTAMGLNIFGYVYVAYLDLVVVLPLAGLILLTLARRRRGRVMIVTPFVRLAAFVFLLGAPVGVYATFIEPFRLKVEHTAVPVPAERAGHLPLRIGVLADLQTGRITDYERDAIDRLMAEKPDLILLPGDIFQSQGTAYEEVAGGFHDLFTRLHAPAGVFCVLGDVDSPSLLKPMFDGTQVRLIMNQIVRVEYAGRRITIGGTQLHFRLDAPQDMIKALESAPGDDDIRILLAHRPDVIQTLPPDARIDLIVAGHTHGGQVVVPFYGPPVTLSYLPRHIAAGGLHEYEENAIYISRGVGCERNQAPRIRFLCPPEISILTLQTAGPQ